MIATSAQRKLARGIEQARALYGETKAFEEGQAYVLRTERERESAEEIRYVAYAVERQATPEDWPLILGEIVHNLRAALDHVVYAQVNPQERSRRTQFPVFTDPREFEEGARPMLRGIKRAVVAIIKNAQPFKMAIPEIAPLYILHNLWNIDKHRELATVAATISGNADSRAGAKDGIEHPTARRKFGTRGPGSARPAPKQKLSARCARL